MDGLWFIMVCTQTLSGLVTPKAQLPKAQLALLPYGVACWFWLLPEEWRCDTLGPFSADLLAAHASQAVCSQLCVARVPRQPVDHVCWVQLSRGVQPAAACCDTVCCCV